MILRTRYIALPRQLTPEQGEECAAAVRIYFSAATRYVPARQDVSPAVGIARRKLPMREVAAWVDGWLIGKGWTKP